MSQTILLWFLPLYLLLLGSDNAIQDYQTGIRNAFISRMGRKKYYLEKMITSFFIAFMTMFISLLVNLILVSIFFRNGMSNKGFTVPNNFLFSISIEHPYLAVFFFSLICCILAGLVGLLGAGLSLFFLDRKYSYSAAFFIWFFLVLREDSLMYLFQPFAEYGFEVLIPILLIAITIFISIPALIFFYEVKYNVE